MRLVFDDGTLLLDDAPESVPYADWDDRVNEYRARAQHYREIRDWATGGDGQATLQESTAAIDTFQDDDVLDLGAEVMLPDFAIEHPDGRRVLFEIMRFWTPEYLDEKLAKLREASRDNLIVAVSERLDCSSEDFEGMDDRVLWFKSGIHVYDVVELAEEYAVETVLSE